MKRFLLFLFILGSVFGAIAQGIEPVKLNGPYMDRGLTIMKAFAARASVREWSPEELSLQDLSDLLWAANGVNRPDEKKRTAPSAMNAQDIDIYVFMTNGIYIYDAFGQVLNPVQQGDHRGILGKQESPVVLVLVSDISRFRAGDNALKLSWAAMDAGIVSQNIGLFCAGVGLQTRPRAGFDKEKVREILRLNENQHPMLNQPVGHGK